MNHYTVKDVMRRCKITLVEEQTPLIQAVEMMDNLEVSALPVSRGHQLIGVLSKSDVASTRFFALLKSGVSFTSLRVKDLMNKTPPVHVLEDQPLREALKVMHRRHIHRVFVANQHNQVIGVLSTTDLLHLMVVDNF